MEIKNLELINFKKIDALLKGFKNTTGLSTAILDLDGSVLSHSEWRKLCNEFYLKNSKPTNWCTDIKIELAEKLADGEDFYYFKNTNGLVEVAVPILINGEHIANLFSGLFFFEKPDLSIFKNEGEKYGFDEKVYINAINTLPIVSLDKIKDTMDFLLRTIQFIIEIAYQKIDKKALKKEFSINKQLIESIIDNSPALIYIADTDGKLMLVNNVFQKLFALQKFEIIGKFRQEFMPIEIAKQHRNNDIDVIQSKKSIYIQEENIESDGKHYYISQKFPLFDLNGNINAVGGISTDVTENVRIKEALIKSENKYKSLFENSADGIIVFNEQSEIIELNNKICEILGYNREEMILLKGYEFIHSEDLVNKDHAATLEQLQQGKTILTQYRLLKKDGSYIYTELSVKMVSEGHFLNIIRDITERKNAEKALQEREKLLSVIFNNHTDLQLLINITNKEEYLVEAINNPFNITASNFGITLNNDLVIGKSIQNLFKTLELSDDYYHKSIASYNEVINTCKPISFRETISIKGNIYNSEITLSPIMNENGVCQYVLYNSHNITEQTNASNALKESEEKFKQIFLTSPDFVTITQIEDGTYLDVNENFLQKTGYSRDEIIGKTAKDIKIWNNIEERNKMLSKLIKFGKVENMETKFSLKNGSIIDGLLSAAYLKINNKLHILTITRDITELKIAEQAFKETASNLRSMIDNREDSIWSIDRDFNYIIFNNTYENIVNNQYNIKLKKGMSSTDNLTEEQANFWIPMFESVFEGKNITFEFSHYLNDELHHFQTSLNPIIEDNVITGATGLSIDVTKRKLIEEALKLSKEKFEKSFRLSPFLIILSTFEGQVIEVNDRIYESLGYTRDEFIARNAVDNPLWVDIHDRQKLIDLLKRDDYVSAKEVLFYKKSGEIGIFSWSACIIELDGIKTCLTIVYDITERKNAEKEIKELNSELETKVKERTSQLEAINKELGTFTYSVSHDLKAPLRGIDGYSKLLADIYKPELNEEAQIFIDKIRSSTLQMNQIIDDLLEYSRMERSQLNFGQVKIKGLIDSVLSVYTEELETGRFIINKNFNDIEIFVDSKGFILAFRNIIENAIKFTKGKTNPTIKIKIEEKELSWLISVNDNGIGFDMKYHDKIFNIFQRLQRIEDFPGTGIGLALVSKAMQRMQGKVWAESVPNVGSTFYLEIPNQQ